MNPLRIETGSAEETIAAGRRIANMLQPGMLILLRGELGAGKTTLMKGVVQAIGAAEPDEVTSPTFTLIHEYVGRMNSDTDDMAPANRSSPVHLYHLDLYRLETENQLATLGLEELLSEDAIVVVEWGEKFPSITRRCDGQIVMEHAGGDRRVITAALQ